MMKAESEPLKINLNFETVRLPPKGSGQMEKQNQRNQKFINEEAKPLTTTNTVNLQYQCHFAVKIWKSP